MKDIYEVRYFGVYFIYRYFSGIDLYRSKEERIIKQEYSSTLFEVRLLKEYKGKEDVLEIKFEDGTSEYETLYEPALYYEDGMWKKASYREIEKEFLKLFEQDKKRG